MPLAPDFVLKAGRYKDLTTGQINYHCSCPGSRFTLKQIAANRQNYEVWPQPAPAQIKPQGAGNAGQTV